MNFFQHFIFKKNLWKTIFRFVLEKSENDRLDTIEAFKRERTYLSHDPPDLQIQAAARQ